MILPYSRYQFSTQKRKKGGFKIAAFFLILILIMLIITIFVFNIFNVRNLFRQERKNPKDQLYSLWESQEYVDLNILCESILEDTPLDYETLVLNGFAYFYRGYSKYTLEEQLPLIDEAIKNLRQAELANNYIDGKVCYILGKAYYYKGRYYTDSTIAYLKRAIDEGYIGESLYEYLGFAYSTAGWYEESIDSFLKALDSDYSDRILSAIGETYKKMGDSDKAEEYYLRCIEVSQSTDVEINSRLKLGMLYYEKKEYEAAIGQFTAIIEMDSNNTDARVYLGDVYLKQGNYPGARKQWRDVIEINPGHPGAIQRLQ